MTITGSQKRDPAHLSLCGRVIVSACLAGKRCTYRQTSHLVPSVRRLVDLGRARCVCPEELGGLPTPRERAEIVGGAGADVLSHNALVFTASGKDVTKQFIDGARKALAAALRFGAIGAILKSKSPSCGAHAIYDGSFRHRLHRGCGVTAALFAANGIRVISERELASPTPTGPRKVYDENGHHATNVLKSRRAK